jgi:glycosyltransferase involved in cell wall biosynthesis
MMEDVAVIIPVYNRRSLVIDALESVKNQTVSPDVVVIVDDASTDGTYESVQAWIQSQQQVGGKHKPAYKLLRQEKGTAALAREYGMSAIPRARFVGFLDSDDRWPSDFIERTTRVLGYDQEAIAVSANRQFVDPSGVELQYDDCSKLASSPLKWMFRYGAGVASCTMFRWNAVIDAGGWDSGLESAEDALLFSQISLLGDWKHVLGSPVVFRVHQAGELGEAGNLSSKFSDRFERWAVTYELIFRKVAEYVTTAEQKYLEAQVGNYWYRAGKTYQKSDQRVAAVSCFKKALGWNRRLLRARFRLLKLGHLSP